uniref:Uncharacterized protein n=1 Tax=Arundo donax TaxID=35708 RepID=A0A0A9H9S9_ARUDO
MLHGYDSTRSHKKREAILRAMHTKKIHKLSNQPASFQYLHYHKYKNISFLQLYITDHYGTKYKRCL